MDLATKPTIDYRVVKYDPKFRDRDGRYLKNDWTSISDIGKDFDGIKLELEEYQRIEEAYIATIDLFLRVTSVDCLVSEI